MSHLGQTRPGRADGRSGDVGYPPGRDRFSGAANFVMCHGDQMKERANEAAYVKDRSRGPPLLEEPQ
jgi:hypothetical protein